MGQTKQKKSIINNTYISSMSNCVFLPSDWSIFSIPGSKIESKRLAANLYNMPTKNHILFLLSRETKNKRIKSLSNLVSFENEGWKFLDSVSVTYEKPSVTSSNGFLPLSEHGYIFYKGDEPTLDKTSWFNPEYKDSSNLWDLQVGQVSESDYFKNTYSQKFSWELNLLLYSLVGIRANMRFTYGVNISVSSEIKSLINFCEEMGLSCELLCNSEEKNKKITKVLEREEQ